MNDPLHSIVHDLLTSVVITTRGPKTHAQIPPANLSKALVALQNLQDNPELVFVQLALVYERLASNGIEPASTQVHQLLAPYPHFRRERMSLAARAISQELQLSSQRQGPVMVNGLRSPNLRVIRK